MRDASPRERAVAAVAEHAPEHRGSWSPLGGGLDHRAFRVGDLVVRVTAPEARAEVTSPTATRPTPAPPPAAFPGCSRP